MNANHTSGINRLAALGAHLSAHGFTVELTAHGLKVVSPDVAECCPGVKLTSEIITCAPRREDGGRLWYWTSWGAPLAEADRITDAKVAILGTLADRSVRAKR